MSGPFTSVILPSDESAANQIKVNGNNMYSMLLQQYLNNYNLVWNNKTASPDKIVAALGTEAVKTFTLSAALAQFLVLAGAVNIPLSMPSNWNYTAHQDGSVTLTGAPPTITSIDVASTPAIGGATLTITGTNLAYTTGVVFGTVAAQVTRTSVNTVVVTVPAGAVGSAPITLTTLYGTATTAFNYV